MRMLRGVVIFVFVGLLVAAVLLSFGDYELLQRITTKQERTDDTRSDDAKLGLQIQQLEQLNLNLEALVASLNTSRAALKLKPVNGIYASLAYDSTPKTEEDEQRYCDFLLVRTRKAPPSYCNWTAPNCTFPDLITTLGGGGTHAVANMLESARLLMPHEQVPLHVVVVYSENC